MKSVAITLDTIEKVKKFVNVITTLDSDCDLSSGRYVVDAKSIMGIFSLDLSQELMLTIQNDKEADKALPMLKEFIA